MVINCSPNLLCPHYLPRMCVEGLSGVNGAQINTVKVKKKKEINKTCLVKTSGGEIVSI